MYNDNSVLLKTIKRLIQKCKYEILCRFFKELDNMAANIPLFYSDQMYKLSYCLKLQNCKCTSFLE